MLHSFILYFSDNNSRHISILSRQCSSTYKRWKYNSGSTEERFTRKKHDANYPFKAVEYVLKEGNLKLNQIDHIVFFEKPFLKFERLLETYLAFAPRGFKSFSMSMPIWLREKLFQKKYLFDHLKKHDENFSDIDRIKFSEHHYSHAASAFFLLHLKTQ